MTAADERAAESPEPASAQPSPPFPAPGEVAEFPRATKAIVQGYLTGALFAVALVALATAGHGPARIIPVPMLALVCYGMVRLTIATVRRTPLLRITEAGVELPATGPIAWSEIRSAAVVRGRSDVSPTGYLGLVPADFQAFVAGLSPARRPAARRRNLAGEAPIRLAAESLAVPLEEVLDTMRRFRPELPALVGS